MALQRITLRDFVLVESLELELASGFSALTGETGAGKSILIEALQLVMGARADAGVVREGCARADISATFELPQAAKTLLDEYGMAADTDDENSLLLRRSIDNQGKSRGWINGIPATATQLRALGALLVDIYGQHAWQSLLQAEALRQSILKQAFAGKLVPQDPSDEPVEKLLARIRAERAAANPDKIKSAKRKVK